MCRVVIHSRQPSPYPTSLIMGTISEAYPGGVNIVLKHGHGVEDAQWVEVKQIKNALEGGAGRPDAEAEGAVL